MITQKTIVSIDIGEFCFETYPCQHRCQITYNDGSVATPLLGARTLISEEYYQYLDEPSKEHFSYLMKKE
jgi:hypothetical protein